MGNLPNHDHISKQTKESIQEILERNRRGKENDGFKPAEHVQPKTC